MSNLTYVMMMKLKTPKMLEIGVQFVMNLAVVMSYGIRVDWLTLVVQ